ncbi:MAG TPA: carbohydrate ABC transporter permease [Geminicoccaceae bacterium]|nr:carbohydrate ABC transporter permease [Geminicoccus sp.]HMU48128.1 carbohydrate ABC transporter permease [Geminicoccaceae bacterium]
MRETWSSRTARGLGFLLVVVWSALPILLVMLASIRPAAEIFTFPPRFLFVPTFENYAQLARNWPDFFDALWNSLIVTVGATVLTIFATTLSGFVYARYRSSALAGSAFFMIFIRMLPPIVITLPLFPIVNRLHLNDTHLILIILYATFFVSLNTWIMKAFIDQIPKELDESAIIDGANALRILWHVVLPLAAPGMIAASTFVLVFSWNEFLFAFIFTTTEAKTAPLILSEMLGALDGVEWGVLFAAATLQLLPVLAFVMLVQKAVIAGMTAGSVKG